MYSVWDVTLCSLQDMYNVSENPAVSPTPMMSAAHPLSSQYASTRLHGIIYQKKATFCTFYTQMLLPAKS
jgi:hypothetical protein